MATKHLGWKHTCDRCGETAITAEEDPPDRWRRIISLYGQTARDERDYDTSVFVCPDCRDSFKVWRQPRTFHQFVESAPGTNSCALCGHGIGEEVHDEKP